MLPQRAYSMITCVKAQEALYELVQIRRHYPELQSARILLVTGHKCFLPQEAELLIAKIGPDFHIVSVEACEQLKKYLS